MPTADRLFLTAYRPPVHLPELPSAYCLLLYHPSGRTVTLDGCGVMVSQSARTRSHS
jgi:hypothetical protein